MNEHHHFHPLVNLRTGWLLLTVINFVRSRACLRVRVLFVFIFQIFGVCGIVTCTLKLRNADKEVKQDYFKISIIFASINLVLSFLLLVSVIKNNQKYAFICAFLSFVSLFFAVVHVENGMTANTAFLIIFIIFGILFFLWFCMYVSYQLLYRYKGDESDIDTPV